MIVTVSQVIPRDIADDAQRSLDPEISLRRAEGVLDAGIKTFQTLQWTDETKRAADKFVQAINVELLKDLGLNWDPDKKQLEWAGPIVYADNMDKPISYSTSNLTVEVIGILAVGPLQLPEVGNSGAMKISSGSVALFRAGLPVVYRSCGGGRGILFHVKL